MVEVALVKKVLVVNRFVLVALVVVLFVTFKLVTVPVSFRKVVT